MAKENEIYNMAAWVQVPGRQKARLADAIDLWDGHVDVEGDAFTGWRVALPDAKGFPVKFAITELVYEAIRLVLATKRWKKYLSAHPEARAAVR